MIRISYLYFVLFALLASGFVLQAQPYKNPNLSAAERTHDLLSRMTLEEKVGQMLCPMGWEMYEQNGDEVSCSDKFKNELQKKHTGMLWATYRADPWTRKTLDNGLNPEMAAKAGNALQRYCIEETRLGIPIFLAEESPHGHMAIGTTVFPTGIALASSWSEDLLTEVGAVMANEIRLQGAHIAYGPVLDLARDPRWSRVEETFGEDPVLSAKLGAAMVKGEGAGDLSNENSVISTLKHFVAYGVPESGQNGNASSVGMHELHQNFLPPFKAAIDAGALSVMTSYNSIDGIPCTANSYLYRDILQNDWNFSGYSVSDLYSIEGIHGSHYVAPTIQDAAVLALEAGVDVDLGGDAYTKLIAAAKESKIKEDLIDSAAYRVLRLKFEMGLFENPYVDPLKAKQEVRNEANITIARKAAQQAIVLLKNTNNLLPLDKNIGKVAVIGPNAHNRYNMLGDYTAPQEDSNVKTILDGISTKIGAKNVEYVKGCSIRDTTWQNIEEAVAAAKNADVIVVAVGGSSARDFKTSYKETGAAVASSTTVSDMECGEGFDRATLGLLGYQMDLLRAVKATGKPLIVVYIEGRPLNMNWADENADALLNAWYPGQEGGNAIADILFGDYNPAGRLPVTVPRNVGQVPIYYNKKNPNAHNYVELSATPLYPFGYGLSYTTFEYKNLKVEKLANDKFKVSFVVKNTGNYDGDEVAQLYLRDEYASMVQPMKQLKHFKRIFLKKQTEKELSFTITEDDLSIVNRNLKRVVETGSFKLMIGSASDNIRLESTLRVD
ncbi:glycoside hydrolase family 3 C-terminal domain-containing protein [Prolixibacteraceae bacterium Z1-6]|uniref:Glycoside hydrolase family 3 C-terminal domain-containing protein n=1 Tax=Draconibacterium aestuarii TaxID=2998507 RepID=A0A9X3FEK7_9BACT|nr:glycoside hydrolase family 3 C-terminal domain-containing protein [Prolixibacteraceae bacterium Z1-6]